MAKLAAQMLEKPWGRDMLPAPFAAPPGQRIGEICFTPPHELGRLLIKYIFTSEALSVQVHPSDAQAEGGHGKEECWLVTTAEPGAKIGIGFDQAYDAETIRAAALDGSIAAKMCWFPVSPGDFFYIPAGTVHAIGAGVGLIEVQQNSDITYRLYDYGRPRDLHLDAGMAVAQTEPYDRARLQRLPPRGQCCLVDGPHFRLDRLDGPPDAALLARYAGAPVQVVASDGALHLPDCRLECGEAAMVSDLSVLTFMDEQCCLIAQSIQ